MTSIVVLPETREQPQKQNSNNNIIVVVNISIRKASFVVMS